MGMYIYICIYMCVYVYIKTVFNVNNENNYLYTHYYSIRVPCGVY